MPSTRPQRRLRRATAVSLLTLTTLVLAVLYAPIASAASEFFVTGIPSPLRQGTPADVLVVAYDEDGSIDTSYRGTIHFTSTDPAATLPPDHTFTAGDNGDHNFPNAVILRTVGDQIVTATDTSTSITGQQTEIQVIEGGATSFDLVGIPSPTRSGKAVSPTVTAYNEDSSIDTGYRGTVHFTSTDPEATLPPDYTFTTGDNGTHTFTTGVILRTVGTQSVTVTDASDAEVSGSQQQIQVLARTATTTTVDGKGSPAKETVTGTVSPAHTGINVTVTLFKKKNGTFVRAATKRPLLTAASTFKTTFRKQPGKACKVTAEFPGDEDHLKSNATDAFKC
ncbi:MAG: hypothetical protein M3323_15810 [Actinomycetota bacterium]|nr:hypothetical protein [Actinomycetota bacterium]